MKFHTIITHEYPDLDAMLCCYLLYHYGEEKYPGVSNARILFYPAGQLPENKSPDELEQDGILVVDIGGGRFDTHPVYGENTENKPIDLSAANLVAQDLGIDNKEGLKELLEFTRWQDSTGQSLKSTNPIDHTFAIPNIIKGCTLKFENNFEDMVHSFMFVFKSIETANLNPDEDFLIENCDNFMLAMNQNKVFIPDEITLKSLLAIYLAVKYCNKEVSIEAPPENSKKWHDFFALFDSTSLLKNNELSKIFNFVKKIKQNNCLLSSNSPLDKTVSLMNMLKGCTILYKNDKFLLIKQTFLLFDYIINYERNWQKSITEYQKNKKVFKLGKLKLVSIFAENGVVIKVARWMDKPDVIVYKDSNYEYISVLINKLGRMRNSDFCRLAARIRTVELLYRKEIYPDKEELFKEGEIADWFLHQSKKLLVHGSPKAKREPSLIPFDLIVEIVMTELDRERKLPSQFCPCDSCIHNNCQFYPLRLPNCFHHRQNLRDNNTLRKSSDTDENIINNAENFAT